MTSTFEFASTSNATQSPSSSSPPVSSSSLSDLLSESPVLLSNPAIFMSLMSSSSVIWSKSVVSTAITSSSPMSSEAKAPMKAPLACLLSLRLKKLPTLSNEMSAPARSLKSVSPSSLSGGNTSMGEMTSSSLLSDLAGFPQTGVDSTNTASASSFSKNSRNASLESLSIIRSSSSPPGISPACGSTSAALAASSLSSIALIAFDISSTYPTHPLRNAPVSSATLLRCHASANTSTRPARIHMPTPGLSRAEKGLMTAEEMTSWRMLDHAKVGIMARSLTGRPRRMRCSTVAGSPSLRKATKNSTTRSRILPTGVAMTPMELRTECAWRSSSRWTRSGSKRSRKRVSRVAVESSFRRVISLMAPDASFSGEWERYLLRELGESE
mmetsp:Transcript_8583/g.21340  ORF Transcript_8583/g.21340 Transcript_8583/m.21340 type:complete len:384 (+) Transcript_8583:1782-2933(+)